MRLMTNPPLARGSVDALPPEVTVVEFAVLAGNAVALPPALVAGEFVVPPDTTVALSPLVAVAYAVPPDRDSSDPPLGAGAAMPAGGASTEIWLPGAVLSALGVAMPPPVTDAVNGAEEPPDVSIMPGAGAATAGPVPPK